MLVLLALLSSPVMAQDCNVRDLRTQISETNPMRVPELYMQLVQCDENEAGKRTADALARMLPDDNTNDALAAAIGIGQHEAVRGWLNGQEPDLKSRTITKLGKMCGENDDIADFFVASHAALGETFWKERWHRGLSDCRGDEIRSLLLGALDDDVIGRNSGNASQFFSLLEVYARNAGADAVPVISRYLSEPRNDEEAIYLVSVYADAANVGGVVDDDARQNAIEALETAGPNLPPLAVERARDTLVTLGDQSGASKFARHRWRDRITEGSYDYATTATETVTCKNGKQQAVLHIGAFREPGANWPDQIESKLGDILGNRWTLDAAAKCNGTGELTYALPAEPFASDEERDAWVQEQVDAFNAATSGWKTKVVTEDKFDY